MGQPTDMTLFYYKSDGDIYSYCGGKTDLSHFSKHEADHALMLDYVILPYSNEIMNNIANYMVDLETKEVILSATGEAQFTKYKKVKKIG